MDLIYLNWTLNHEFKNIFEDNRYFIAEKRIFKLLLFQTVLFLMCIYYRHNL